MTSLRNVNDEQNLFRAKILVIKKIQLTPKCLKHKTTKLAKLDFKFENVIAVLGTSEC